MQSRWALWVEPMAQVTLDAAPARDADWDHPISQPFCSDSACRMQMAEQRPARTEWFQECSSLLRLEELAPVAAPFEYQSEYLMLCGEVLSPVVVVLWP